MNEKLVAVSKWIGTCRKAIVGVLVGVVAAQLVQWGVDLSQAQTDLLTVVLTGLSVYLFPNDDPNADA